MAYQISVPVSPVFRFPSEKSEHTDELLFGETVEIIDTVDRFVRIKTISGYTGYIRREDFSERLEKPNRMIVLPFADLLPEPKNCHAPVMTLPLGALVDVGFSHDKEYERYGFVVLPDKRIFCVHKNALGAVPVKPESQNDFRDAVVENAKRYMGVQYRWGGCSPFGIDCSGLVYMAYRLAGVTLWRDAEFDKNPLLREISLEDAQKGDLLYFSGHVAIYLESDLFIHSSASAGKVSYGSFDPKSRFYSEWYGKNLLKVGTLKSD